MTNYIKLMITFTFYETYVI